jgi:ATP-dependent DNA helicase RecG
MSSTITLEEIINKLKLPLPLEAKLGFQNLSVFGGLDKYAVHWIKQALILPLGEAQIKKIQALELIFLNYNEAAINSRKEKLKAALDILSGFITQPMPDLPKNSPPPGAASKPPLKRYINLETPVQYLKGIGPEIAKKLERLEISTAKDLFYHVPRRYEDRSQLKKIAYLQDEDWECTSGIIREVNTQRLKGGLTLTKAILNDDTGKLQLTWFNQNYLQKQLKPGKSILVWGKAERKFSGIEIQNPEWEEISQGDNINLGRIVPFYPSTAGLSQKFWRKAIYNNLPAYLAGITEPLPLHLRDQQQLTTADKALWSLHFPDNFLALEQARKRLAFEELLTLQLQLLLRKASLQNESRPCLLKLPPEAFQSFLKELPFTLTQAQQRVISEIWADLKAPHPMHRLLQGDVGSGKTVIAAFGVFAHAINGSQSAILAPTEILAQQHYEKLNPLLEALGIKAALLTGTVKKKERNLILEELAGGNLKVLIGTHALLEEDVCFANLGLAVVDEQHKFGVKQRTALSSKGKSVDLLVMSATPIPRSLALALYGDLDISVLDELPPGRKPVKTYWVAYEGQGKAYAFIKKQLNNKAQAYVVCPVIEEQNKLELTSAIAEAKRLAQEVFPEFKVSLLHGKMKGEEKEAIMRSFREHELDLLISTTVIEVGVDVPNASVMLVQNAERFGLSQLHQLRGRIGRGSEQAYCLFLSDAHSLQGKQRLQAIVQCADGFALAEQDLRLRGPGEFWGTRQHGYPDLKVADIVRDVKLMEPVRQLAKTLIAEKFWEQSEYQTLAQSLEESSGSLMKMLH